jgi:beta-fructofuranosidase
VPIDPHRPSYHVLPPANWLNDPNGLIQWHGQYHVFYQHNPFAPVWGTIHWGHAVSSDLAHWRDLPIALAPTPGGVDADGVFSGCALDHDGVPTVIYTGVTRPPGVASVERPCLASSDDDDLRTWHKNPANPVIPAPPVGLDVLGFRDHSVWRDDRLWYQVIGSGIRGVGGAALLYRSPDLVHWDYLGPLLVGDGITTGTMWECPDFFPLDDRHVLLVSPIPLKRTLFVLGRYQDHRFVPEHQGEVDLGGSLYAPQTFRDERGRRIMFGWLREDRDEAAQRAAGWAGVLTLPRSLTLTPTGHLAMQPASELELLRQSPHHVPATSLTDTEHVLDGVRGLALELRAVFAPRDATQVGLAVRRTPDGHETTELLFDRARRQVVVDRARSSTDPTVQRDRRDIPFELGPDEPLELRVFVDGSVVELFVNGRLAVASRVYPSRPDSLGVAVIARGGAAELQGCVVWPMQSGWPER